MIRCSTDLSTLFWVVLTIRKWHICAILGRVDCDVNGDFKVEHPIVAFYVSVY